MSTYRIERLHDPQRLYELLATQQPRAAQAIGAAFDGGLQTRVSRCALAVDESGRVGGAVVVDRWMCDRWLALPVLLEAGAACAIGSYIDQGPADGMHCTAGDAQLLMPHLSRICDVTAEVTASLPWPIVWDDPDPRCRVARPEDDDQLIELYWASELNFITTKRALRRLLRRAKHETFVFDDGTGRILGMANVMTRTPEYDVGGDAVVHPESRDQGVAWALVGFAICRANDRKVGGLVFVRDSNPMSVPADTIVDDDFVYATLGAPRRFRGEPRLHGLWFHAVTRDKNRVAARHFTHDRVDRGRRTQQAWRERLDKTR